MEKCLKDLQKVKHRITIWPRNSTPKFITQRTESREGLKHIFVYACSQQLHSQQPKGGGHPGVNGWWTSYMWSIHTMEYYSALKRSEMLTQDITGMEPEDIRLSEISQSQRDRYCVIPLIWGPWSHQIQRQKVEWWLPGAGGGGGESGFNGNRVSVWGEERVLWTDGGDGRPTLWIYLMPLNCMSKNY